MLLTLVRTQKQSKWGILMLSTPAIVSSACGTSTNPAEPSNGIPADSVPASGAPLRVNLAFCDALTELTAGRLCAIQPSKTHSAI